MGTPIWNLAPYHWPQTSLRRPPTQLLTRSYQALSLSPRKPRSPATLTCGAPSGIRPRPETLPPRAPTMLRAPRTPTPPRARSTLPPREAQAPAASGSLGPESLDLLSTPRHTCLRLGDPARGPVPPPRPQPRPPRLGKQLQMRSPAPTHQLADHTASAVFIGLCTRPSRALDATSFLVSSAGRS